MFATEPDVLENRFGEWVGPVENYPDAADFRGMAESDLFL
jgi:hypothetical protein